MAAKKATPTTSIGSGFWSKAFGPVLRTIKGHPKVSIPLGALLVTGIVGRIAYDSAGETVFPVDQRGLTRSVGDRRPTYEEGVFVGSFDRGNVLAFRNKGIVYELIDSDGMSIDWREETAPDFANDEFDRINMTDREGTITYTRDQIDDGTIEGKYAAETFELGDNAYRVLREGIRQARRDAYGVRVTRLLEGLRVDSPTPTPDPSSNGATPPN